MSFICRNKKHIAIIILVPIVFILLFACTFRKFNLTYNGGNIDSDIVNQSKEFILSNDSMEIIKSSFQVNPLTGNCLINIISGQALLSFIILISRCRSRFLYKKRYTLVSLCVRMNK